MRWNVLLLALSAVSFGATAQETTDSLQRSTNRVVEEIQVVGKISGPPIWRVSNGENDLWILGYPMWVPEDLTWQSDFLDDVMTHADEFLTYSGARYVPSNPLKAIRALRQFRRMQRIRDRGTLGDVLSEDQYRLFKGVKLRYLPKRNNLERMRPSFASKEIFESAADSAGLVRGRTLVHLAMEKRAKKHKVTKLPARLSLSDTAVLDAMEKMPRSAGQFCLQVRLQDIDAQLEALTSLAVAWAEGDLALAKSYNDDSVPEACHPLASQPKELMQLVSRSLALWHENADRALRNNESTFATVPLNELLHTDGPLSRLSQRGYQTRVL